MSLDSDPYITRADRRSSYRIEGEDGGMIAAGHAPLPSVRRTLFQRVLVRAAVIMGLGLLVVHTLGGLLAEPLPPAINAPLWNVEITSSSTSSVVALAYSRETGIHLLRVPGADSRSGVRSLPAHLARGDLHIMSLGLAGLRAHASGPAGVPLNSWSAEGHLITAFQRPDLSGVRTSW